MFDGLVGQNDIKGRLEAQILRGGLKHAYLFYGEAGMGKRAFAGAFAEALLCAGGPPRPCGACAPCRLFHGGALDDYFPVAAKGKSITIDEIRRAIGWVSVRPMISPRKALVIADADKMTEQAQNALLKTLEEPPRYVHAVLTASRPEALLGTIRSRCEAVRFARYADGEIRLILAGREASAPPGARRPQASPDSGGSVRGGQGGLPNPGGGNTGDWGSAGNLGSGYGAGDWGSAGAADSLGGYGAAGGNSGDGLLIRLAGGVPGKAIELAQSDSFAQLRAEAAERLGDIIMGKAEAAFLLTEFLERQKNGYQKAADIMVHLLRELWARSILPGPGQGGASGPPMRGGAGVIGGMGAADPAAMLPLPAMPQRIPECIEAIESLRGSISANANFTLAANMMAMKLGELGEPGAPRARR